jgi:hypothetical protein
VVVAMVVTVMTGLSRDDNPCKHCQRDDSEHKVTYLHWRSPESGFTGLLKQDYAQCDAEIGA